MYRGRLWTMRQFAGFGTPRQTNERFKFLLEKGQTGLSTAFDLPTLMGLDSDHPRAAGEVGRLGVAMDTLDDMLVLFDGINLETISVSMTINAPAIVLMAFYLAAAQERGFDCRKLRGTIQNDILKEFHAQNEFVFPPEPSVRLVCDVIEFCARHVPQWNPVSISGYHIREAGSTAAQELAFTLADGFHYVEQCLARGMAVDDFAPRLSFFFNAHNDLFEEVAKYRAARVLWADAMRNRYGATERGVVETPLPRPDRRLLAPGQTAGAEPDPRRLPGSRRGARRLPVVAHQQHGRDAGPAVGTRRHAGPAHAAGAGVRNRSHQHCGPARRQLLYRGPHAAMQHDALAYFDRIESAGGMISAIEAGFFRREIADAAFAYQREVDAKRKLIVGLNAFVEPDEKPMETLTVDGQVERDQIAALRASRGRVEAGEVQRCLDEVRRAAATSENLVGPLLQAAHARASVGEIMNALADVFGRYEPKSA